MNSKTLIAIALSVLGFSGIFYKYYEYKTMSSMADTLDRSARREITLMAEANELGDELYNTITEKFGDGTEKNRKKVETKDFDEVVRKIKLSQEKHQEYQEEIEKNQKEVEGLFGNGKFLIGQRKDIYYKIINTIKDYYKTEVPSSKMSGVHIDMLISYFELTHDSSLIGRIDISRRNDPDVAIKEFQNIASLEKYTKSEFKYISDQEIKDNFPYGYEILNRYKEFLKSYYLIIKDLVNRDYDAAAYKYEKFSKDATNLTFDWKKFIDEKKDEDIEKSKIIAEKLIGRLEEQNQFNSKTVGKYPLAKRISFNSADPLYCEVLLIKENIYLNKIDKTPSTSSLDEFITDINKVSPKMDSILEQLNKDSFTLENKDKKTTLTCKDKAINKEYKFTFVKKTD